MSPESLSRLVEMLPSAASYRQIAIAIGVDNSSVRAAAQPFVALMRANGTLQACACGKPRFHRGNCDGGRDQRNLPPQPSDRTAELEARRQAIVDMLIDGERFCRIEELFGLRRHAAKDYIRFLTSEQVATRKRILAANKLASKRDGDLAVLDRFAHDAEAYAPQWLAAVRRLGVEPYSNQGQLRCHMLIDARQAVRSRSLANLSDHLDVSGHRPAVIHLLEHDA